MQRIIGYIKGKRATVAKKQDIAFRYSTQACRFRSPEPIGSQIRTGVNWLEGSLSSNLKRILESSVLAPSLPPIPYG